MRDDSRPPFASGFGDDVDQAAWAEARRFAEQLMAERKREMNRGLSDLMRCQLIGSGIGTAAAAVLWFGPGWVTAAAVSGWTGFVVGTVAAFVGQARRGPRV